jgi:RNA polymerase sigma-70 factor (sigma-E family)
VPTSPDAAAFDAYVSERGGSLLRFAYVLCGDYYLAEDLVQEALVKVHRRWSKVERTDQPGTYVRKAILRQYLSWRRRRSSGELPEDIPDDSNQKPDHAQSLADREALWAALSGLPPKQRAVLVLRFYEDLNDDEIATYVGCSAQTVRSHASRGVARLRGIVRADHFV